MRLLFSTILLSMNMLLFGQQELLIPQVENTLQAEQLNWKLSKDDVSSYVITDAYITKHNGVQHVYVNQAYNSIPIHNAITTLNYNKEGKMFFASNKFIQNIAAKINSSEATILPQEALATYAKSKGVKSTGIIQLKSKHTNIFASFQAEFSKNTVNVREYYDLDEMGTYRLVWQFEISFKGKSNLYNVSIDANTGETIRESDQMISCQFEKGMYHNHSTECRVENQPKQKGYSYTTNMKADAQYRVYPIPAESPLHGTHDLINDPSSAIASPYGWHDTDGVDGEEYTITRGNNVHAYEDKNENNSSRGNEPDGGDALLFNFTHKKNQLPDDNEKADVTNLFYMNNVMHDFTYLLGFDEVAGNFQENNYGNGGRAGDYVHAEALDGEDTNNANFGTPSDGANPAMQMFKWDISASADRLKITSPAEISGIIETGEADFGTSISVETPISGTAIIVEDGDFPFGDGCSEILNSEDISGNIALIDRGICEFGTKSFIAQNAGAVGVIICNFEESILNMAGGSDGGKVDIPVVLMKKSDCDRIKISLNSGTPVGITFQLENVDSDRPSQYSSSFDNGVIAHEYGHGISNRLTGGPSASGCLENDEQMGEGWSDFFALVITHEAGDEGPDSRGIGTYLNGQAKTGGGIRAFPYSTDMSISPYTYNTIRGTTAPHPLGSVWTACTWDLYWAMIDEYGYDANLNNKNSGNSKAIQLVMDGMKMQACSPGFVEGRNAILAADQANNSGENECLIWKVFARRGVGYFVKDGGAEDRNDNEEDFEPLPSCIPELKIRKTITNYVEAGDDIHVELAISNDKTEMLSGIVVEDNIPSGTSLITNSSSMQVSQTGNKLSFDIGNMASLSKQTISYSLSTKANTTSHSKFYDNMDDGESTLYDTPINDDNSIYWILTDDKTHSGEWSWFMESSETELDQGLITTIPYLVTNNTSTLKFWHRFDTESGFDGGFLEASIDNGETWNVISKESFIRNKYNSAISYSTIAIPGLGGFTGDSQGWIDTYVNLSDYLGKEILVRFRFVSNDESPGDSQNGWYIDDVEFLDLRNYNTTEACITSDSGDLACDEDGNTIINSIAGMNTPTNDISIIHQELLLSPNPTSDILNIQLNVKNAGVATVYLVNITGKKVLQKHFKLDTGENSFSLDVSQFVSGIYFLETLVNGQLASQKVIIE